MLLRPIEWSMATRMSARILAMCSCTLLLTSASTSVESGTRRRFISSSMFSCFKSEFSFISRAQCSFNSFLDFASSSLFARKCFTVASLKLRLLVVEERFKVLDLFGQYLTFPRVEFRLGLVFFLAVVPASFAIVRKYSETIDNVQLSQLLRISDIFDRIHQILRRTEEN